MNLLNSFLPLRVVYKHYSKLLGSRNPVLFSFRATWHLGIPAGAGILAGYLGCPGHADHVTLLTAEISLLAFISAILLALVAQNFEFLKDTKLDAPKSARKRLALLADNFFFGLLLSLLAMLVATIEIFDWGKVLLAWPQWPSFLSKLPGQPGPMVEQALWGMNIALLTSLVLTVFTCLQRFHFLVELEAERVYPTSPQPAPAPVPNIGRPA